MLKLDKQSIDLICVDLPYGTTQNDWDIIIPFDKMWDAFSHVLKNKGCIVLTAAQPFASKLITSNLDMYKYDMIWEKTIGSGQLNINKQPLRVHEHILVFYKEFGTYNEQLGVGTPYSIKRKAQAKSNYGAQKESSLENDGTRRARSVVKIKNPRIPNGHPTQKPIELMEYIINTWSNVNDTVLDCCMGSGSTGIAAIKLKRDFVGIEMKKEYYDLSYKQLMNPIIVQKKKKKNSLPIEIE